MKLTMDDEVVRSTLCKKKFIQIIQFQKISSIATVVESSTIWTITPHSIWLVMCSMYGSQFVPPLCIACDGLLCRLHDEVVAQRALDRRL